MPTRQQVEDVLIEHYTSEMKANPKFDRKLAKQSAWEDDPDNPEYIERTREERVSQGPWIVFRASDGMNSITTPRISDMVDKLVEAGLVEP